MTISKRMVLRSGFGIVVGLLVASTILAWRIQESFSERSVEIHRKFVHEQELLTGMRRIIWSVGIYLRDYYLNPSSDPAGFEEQLDKARVTANDNLADLRRTGARPNAVDELEKQFAELWHAAHSAARSQMDPDERFLFLQQEIIPRRDSAGRLLRQIEKANTSSLAESESEFRDTRTGATSRLVIILAVCVLCGSVVAAFSMRHSERLEFEAQKRFAEVSEAKAELERLSARLMEVQEEERTRLSRELHDEIVQNLAVMKMELTQAQTLAGRGSPASEPLNRARALADTTVRSVRDISVLLRPSLLDDLGLVPALQWQAEEFTRRTGVPCEIEENLNSDSLPEAVKTCVYRVTQEALRNIEKHSGATRVSVRVMEQPDSLSVEIRDNGRGFAPNGERQPFSLGLLGMKERAASVGGTLFVGNVSGGGATVRLSIPIQTARPERRDMGVHA